MHEDGDFYVFLPSDGDTRGIYPKNTRGEFTIPIAPPIDCTEIKKIWEVAITDVTIPTSVYNISEEMDRRICVGSFNPLDAHPSTPQNTFHANIDCGQFSGCISICPGWLKSI